ncbi:putative baseplate assembly protein [Nannocystaceae bacterium ST9]
MSDKQADCCTSVVESTRDNPPGRSALRYRVGTHSSFLASMIAQLSKQIVPPNGDPAHAARPLADLRTRSTDDETIALLDAWACALDVLTFYDQVHVQEGFLPTAVQRESVFALAKAIGYTPSPGVAASTTLAFTIDDGARGPASVTIPAGSAALSIPTASPDLARPAEAMRPQTFETIETIVARPEWNLLRATPSKPQVFATGVQTIYLQGLANRLAVGDALLITGKQRGESHGAWLSERWDFRKVVAVESNPAQGWTKVDLDRPLGTPHMQPADLDVQVFVFRSSGSLFGFNAPDFRTMSADIKAAFDGIATLQPLTYKTQWPGFAMGEDDTTKEWLKKPSPRGVIDLDRVYDKLVKGGWVVLQDRTHIEAYRIENCSPTSRTNFTLTSKCTRLFLDGWENLTQFQRRATLVHLESERLELCGQPDTTVVSGQEVRIAGTPTAMAPGRVLIARGLDAQTGAPRVERVTLRSWTAGATWAELRFEDPLVHAYRRDSFELLGNVAAATHGAGVREAIGSGDASKPNQRFALLQAPMTWVPAATVQGRESSLELTIDGVLWTRVDALLDAGPDDRVYQLDVDAEGRTSVVLGDGRHGARAPSGLENVVARYRKGVGLSGEVASGEIGLMTAGPPGVRQVVNPVPASGAEDPESILDARRNAPSTVLTLGRLVSVSDYQDFARTFAGIGKAHASALWTGKRSVVHLTVASASGQVLDESTDTIAALRAAILRNADPSQVPLISSFDAVEFCVHLRIARDPAWTEDALTRAVRVALSEHFSFARREFAQPVAASEIVAIVQSLPGVLALDLDALHRHGQAKAFHALLVAKRATWSGYGVSKAELLLLPGRLITFDWIAS